MPSAIGDVLPALVAVWTAALAAESATVYGGPKPTSATALEYVTVGFDPTGDGEGVTTNQVISDLGNRWIDESGDVVCSVTVSSGGDDLVGLLARADDLFDLCDAALVADPTLGGVLTPGAGDGGYARVLGAGGLEQSSGAQGSAVRLTFTAHYSTLLTS